MNQNQICARAAFSKKTFLPWLWLAIVLAVFFSTGDRVRANLVINPVWDSSITSDPNAATITNTIMQAIAVYESSFSDNITVNIDFQEMNSGLGESSSYLNTVSYSLFRSHLLSDRSTAYDTNAVANISNTTTNPVNGSTRVNLNLANGRAIGLTGTTQDGFGNYVDWDSSASQPDGYIYLNTAIMNLSRSSINGSKYDLFAVASHEMDEVLGIGSALTGLANGAAAPTGAISPLDLFRYDQNGNRSFNTTNSAPAYFSIDGKTDLVRFNQYAGGDFNDWYSYPSGGSPPRVQDAFATQGATPNLNVELIALDVLGYDLLVPKLSLVKAGTGRETLSWSPPTPGFVLQECTNLVTQVWNNSASGTNNPVTITNSVALKFYRLATP